MTKNITEKEVERMANEARIINEASDGKVSEFAYELSKKVISGEISDDEAIKIITEKYKKEGLIENA